MNWIKCSEKPIPKIGKYLAINKDGDQAVVWFENNYLIKGGWFDGCENGCGGYDYFENATHWIDLPKQPEDE